MKRTMHHILLPLLLMVSMLAGAVLPAAAAGGIANNGTNGIYIDIYSAPYKTYQSKPYGGNAYTAVGCAWFASARAYELTGKDTPIWSGVSWYNTAYSYYGYTRGSTPQAKALACYANHVAVVEAVNGNSITISEGGNTSFPGNGYCAILTMTRAQVESARGGAFLGYVYLGVGGGSSGGGSSGADLGTGFYGYIYSPYANMVLTNTTTDGRWGNVVVSPYKATRKQLWRFERNANGSYVVYSAYGNSCLDVADASTQQGANLTANTPSGHPAQSFYFYEVNGGYKIQTAISSTVVDVAGDTGAVDGTNVAMWDYWGGPNQVFTVTKVPNNYPPFMSQGDISLDNQITAADALLALQYATGKIQLDISYNQIADVNRDGKISATDALMILQRAVGNINSFPAA